MRTGEALAGLLSRAPASAGASAGADPSERGLSSWRAPVLPAYAAWALGVFAVAVIARAVVPVSDHAALGGGSWLALVNFDAIHYLRIARHAYTGSVAERAYFPLFPLLVAALHAIFHALGVTISYALAGTAIAVAAAYGALRALRALLALDLGWHDADKFVWVLLLAPYAFILLAPYAESLMMLTTVGAMLAARKGRWWLAGALGAAASACRPPGLLVFPALLVEYLYQVRRGEKRVSRDILGLALTPLGAAAYFAWLAFHGGIDTYSRAYAVGWPYFKFTFNIFEPLYRPILAHVFHAAYVPSTPLADVLGLSSFAVTIALLVWGWRRIRPSYLVYAALSVVAPLLTTITEGLGRYYLMIFPLTLIAAQLVREHPRLARPAVGVGVLGQVGLIALFVSGHPGVV